MKLERTSVLLLCLALGLAHAPEGRADDKAAAPAAPMSAATSAAAATPQPTQGPVGFAPGKEPTGFGKLAFGTSFDDVKKIYPNMEKTEQTKIAPIFNHPFIERYSIGPQKIEGLAKPCEVELRFWKKSFWLAVVVFGENTNEEMEAYLTKTWGPPNHTTKQYITWNADKAAAVADVKYRWYEVHSETISNDVRQTWISGGLRMTPLPTAHSAQTPAASTASTPAPTAAAK